MADSDTRQAADDAESGSIDLLRIGRNPVVMTLAALPFLGIVPALLGAILVKGFIAVFMLHAVIFGTLLTTIAWNRNPWARIVPTRLRRHGDRITIDDVSASGGAETFDAAEVESAYLTPKDGRLLLTIKRRRKLPIELAVSSHAEGERALSLLGFATNQTAVHFRAMSELLGSTLRSFVAVFLIMLLGVLLAAGMQLVGLHPMVGMATAGLLGAALMLLPSKLTVGADGVLIGWLNRQRFVSFAQLHHVVASEKGWGRSRRSIVTFVLHSGESFDVSVQSRQLSGDERAQAIATRIDAALAAYRRGDAVATAALVARGQRDHRGWVDALMASSNVATHRSAPIAPEALWRIVESATAEPIRRAAAAVALKPRLAGSDKHRLERIASATAAPKLRIALDAVANDVDEAALAEALAEVEAEAASLQQK